MKKFNMLMVCISLFSSLSVCASVDREMGFKKELFLQAARHGCAGTIRQLLREGIDIDSANDFGTTALHFTVFNEHFGITKMLIDEGKACVNKQCCYGNTPLHIAMHDGSLLTAKFLLRRGADVTIKNNENKTPLECAELHVLAQLDKYIKKAGYPTGYADLLR